jgi:hypothetical protein
MRKKLLILLSCIVAVGGGFVAYQQITSSRAGSDQAQIDTSGFVFGKDWSVNYDPATKQVTVTGSIANNTGATHQVAIAVVLRDQGNDQVITSFTEAVTLPKSPDGIAFTFVHASPAFTKANPEFRVAAAY